MEIKTIEQAKELGLDTFWYPNGAWHYIDDDDYWHLFSCGKEALPEIKKRFALLYTNGDWHYIDDDDYWHLIRDGEELLPDVKKVYVSSHSNGDWEYKDTNDKLHTVKRKQH